MPTRTLNLGVLAHVDAGKTSLTERLLFDHGVIAHLGSVDAGDTQTDTSDVERRRGITVRSAVASFDLGDLQVNLVDTPGHPDFIAEVERALSVLDAAVLVISAVEGVQAQTRVLMRSLRRLRLPTLLFVNKIDRPGARYGELLAEIRRRLAPNIVAMDQVQRLGTWRAEVLPRTLADHGSRTEMAEVLADNNERLLTSLVSGAMPDIGEMEKLLRGQTTAGQVHPVFFGSALSGAGVSALMARLPALIQPARPGDPDDAPRGTVFAVGRASSGEKVAYLRLFSGELRQRERVTFRRDDAGAVEEYTGRITGLDVIGGGRTGPLTAGNIAKLRGLPHIRVGDSLGASDVPKPQASFSPPILESVVRPRRPGGESELYAALSRLADEDPLIRTRAAAGGTSVLLYGAVQQEVLAERLEREFGLQAVFEPVQPVYYERPAGTGQALWQFDPRGPNEFWQTVGIRVEPTPVGAGNIFTREAELGLLPSAYHRAIEETAMAALAQGLHGWQVTDCAVFLTRIGYDPPMTVAADFRHLTPMIVLQALKSAGSEIYEPGYRIEVEVPIDCLGGVVGLLAALGADIDQTAQPGPAYVLTGELAARSLQDLAVALPSLTRGEGAIWHEPGADRRVRGPAPTRERADGNPLDHDEYFRFLSQRDLG